MKKTYFKNITIKQFVPSTKKQKPKKFLKEYSLAFLDSEKLNCIDLSGDVFYIANTKFANYSGTKISKKMFDLEVAKLKAS